MILIKIAVIFFIELEKESKIYTEQQQKGKKNPQQSEEKGRWPYTDFKTCHTIAGANSMD